MRVLYVEDDVTMAKTIEQMLKHEGYHCQWVTTGVAAVTLGKTVDYDVILLDIGLPDMDGYDVVRRLRESGVDKPILIQSGLVPQDKKLDGMGFGVEDYLIKPFNRTELFRKLGSAVARHAKQQSSVSERRKHPRSDVSEVGQLVYADGDVAPCTIFSRSSGGAALKVGQAERCLSQSFTLQIGKGEVRRCKTCWQFGNKVGVKFV